MKQKTNPMIIQGAILAAAGIITKLIGFVYRIPMANLLGEEGNGIYSVSFGIYNVALTLSSYSFPLAVSKLVSTRLAKREPKNAFTAFTTALILSVLAGLVSFSILFFGADLLEAIYKTGGLAYPLRILAPTTFAVALLGVFRGYFQGHSNMVPTAISQIFEQIVNAVVSVVATVIALKIYATDEHMRALGAAGATVGTLAGAITALVFIVLTFTSRLSYTRRVMANDISKAEYKPLLIREMLATMLPIIISQTIYQISFTVDDLLFSNLMHARGFEGGEITALQGVFNTQYTQLINIPIAIATAMAASALPEIVRLSVQKRRSERREKITTVIKINMAIAIPCAVGLSVLAHPIITLLFPGLVTYRSVASGLLIYGSLGCVFYALSTVTTSVLQGCNRMRIPVVNAFLSFIVHTLIVFVLLRFTPLGIWARLIGDVTFPLMIATLNIIQLKKRIGFALDKKHIFLYPLLSSLAMGAVTLILYTLLGLTPIPMIISFGISVVTAVVLYGWMVIKLRVFSDDEYLELPAGSKILRLAQKIR
ncbi:MAG: polysaccharide biosynthesis protein [Clostridia bacterium]|nr:polysaccharide biosynthesis protein [Clostridia bacterium]